MRLKLTIIFLLSLVLLFYFKNYFIIQSSSQSYSAVPKTQVQVAEVLIKNLNSLADYSGDVIEKSKVISLLEAKNTIRVFHFWASWCDPCLNELPDFIEFVKKSKSATSLSDIQFYLISQDFDQDGLNKFTKIFPEILSNNFIQLWDKDGVLSRGYSIQKLPATLIVYADSLVVLHDGTVLWENFKFSK